MPRFGTLRVLGVLLYQIAVRCGLTTRINCRAGCVDIEPWKARSRPGQLHPVEKFLGHDRLLSRSSLPRPRQTWLDPVNLFGAATCGRANPNLSGARRVGKVQRIVEPQKKARTNRQRGRNGLLTFEATNQLRRKTPELVRKEIWTHILAYTLIGNVMAQAAAKHDIPPRSISFKSSIQTLEAFQPLIASSTAGNPAKRLRLYHDLLNAIATHRVADRPDRYEPRLKKQRRNHYG
jgi:hypothetical protein